MENIIKNFINYLFEYGLVGIKTIKNIMSSYETNKHVMLLSKSIMIDDKLKLILVDYLKNITGTKLSTLNYENELLTAPNYLLEVLCSDVVEKYKENIRLEKLKKVRLFYKFYKFASESKKLKSFLKFKENTIYIKRSFANKNSISRNNKSKSDLLDYSNSEISKANPNGYFSSSSSIMLSKREEDDKRNCTFQPNIYKNKKHLFKSNEEIFNRLYQEFKILNEKKDLIKDIKEKADSERYDFNPSTHRMKSEYDKTITQDFFHRQDIFKKTHKEKKAKIIQEEDERLVEKCSFKPKLMRSNSCTNIENDDLPRYKKLYENGKRKQKNRSNNTSLSEDKIASSSHTNRHVDYDKINNLYNDYKKKNSIVKGILQNIEQKNGITFKPHLLAGSKYKIDTTFEERNISSNSQEKTRKNSNNFHLKSNEQSKNFSRNSKNTSREKISHVSHISHISNITSRNNISKHLSKEEITSIRSNVVNKIYSSNKNNFKGVRNSNNTNNSTNGNFISASTSRYGGKSNNSNSINNNPAKLEYAAINDSIKINENNFNNSDVSKNDSAGKSTISHKDLLYFTLNPNGEASDRSLRSQGTIIDMNKNRISEKHLIRSTRQFEISSDNVSVNPEYSNTNTSKYKKFKSASLQNLIDNKYC